MSKQLKAGTPFWIGDTVYKQNGRRSRGLVVAVVFEGDPATPLVRYRVTWLKHDTSEEYLAIELTAEAPEPKPAFKA